jgi:hypothetical protein
MNEEGIHHKVTKGTKTDTKEKQRLKILTTETTEITEREKEKD